MDRPIDYQELFYSSVDNPLGHYSYPKLLELACLVREECRYGYQEIRAMARATLMAHHSIPNVQENPLEVGAVLCMVGDSVFKAKALKERLEALGIAYTTRVTAETTHVLLGKNPKNTRGLEEHCKTLLNDLLLQAELDRLEQPYLQEVGTEDTVKHLSDLLMSRDEDNVSLAIELIKGGGFPVELIPQAFWAMKATDNKKIYKDMKSILDKYLSSAGKSAIRRTLQISLDTTEEKLTKKLHKFCRNVSDLDGLAIARELYRYHKKGMQYIWRYSKDEVFKKAVLEQFIQNDSLDLSNKGLSVLPKEVADYPALHTVILRGNEFKTVPMVLSKLPVLSHLDISENYKIKSFSTRLLTMTSLRHLNLYGWLPYWDMPEIKQLTQLEELVLRHISSSYKPYIAENIARALPNCKLSFLP